MGVKDVWTVLEPFGVRKPIQELSGKVVAIDLAGWVCDSMNVASGSDQTNLHLRNIMPVFVLEGDAPRLKSQTMAKRNDLLFRRGKPPVGYHVSHVTREYKERKQFDKVQKQCASLVESLGFKCVKAPGEAEAYCASLNKFGFVDGVVSQDSDCFAYGAKVVYRNFSVSAHGGSVEIYDLDQIRLKMPTFGQNKFIAMALLCGCDYCPEGVPGVGRESVLRFFRMYDDDKVLDTMRSWRLESAKYGEIKMKVDDSSMCTGCGHNGRLQYHVRCGCIFCGTPVGCNESLWMETRINLKAELNIREKAIADPTFPNEDIIDEFLAKLKVPSELDLKWHKPDITKFVSDLSMVLDWQELYGFQKFVPVLTRWLVTHGNDVELYELTPKAFVQKRVVKGVPSVEVTWNDVGLLLKRLVPPIQRTNVVELKQSLEYVFRTVEPWHLMTRFCPEMVSDYESGKLKFLKPIKKAKKRSATKALRDNVDNAAANVCLLEPPVYQTNEVPKSTGAIPKIPMQQRQEAMQLSPGPSGNFQSGSCSTPVTKSVPFELDSDDDKFNVSKLLDSLTGKDMGEEIRQHKTNFMEMASLDNIIKKYRPMTEEVRFDDDALWKCPADGGEDIKSNNANNNQLSSPLPGRRLYERTGVMGLLRDLTLPTHDQDQPDLPIGLGESSNRDQASSFFSEADADKENEDKFEFLMNQATGMSPPQ